MLSENDSVTSEQALGRAALNSLQLSLASAVLTVLIALPAAYGLARFRTRLRTVALGWVLVSQLFPFVLLVIPLFLILRELGLANSHAGLVLVYVVWSLPFALWILQGFVRGVPQELEEAAATDGANRLQVVVRVVAPLLAPGVVATALYSFISAWNEFYFALVLLKDPDLATLPGFFAGQYAMVPAAIWMRQQMVEEAPEDFQWVTLPPLTGVLQAQGTNPQTLSIPQDSPHQEEAMQFLEFFLNPENLAALAHGDWLMPTGAQAGEQLLADTGGEQGGTSRWRVWTR